MLERKNVRSIEHLFLTHPHLDHVGGAFYILNEVDVREIHDNGEDLTAKSREEDIYRWYVEFVRQDSRYSTATTGRKFRLGDLTIEVLSPRPRDFSADWNTNSLVLAVRCHGMNLLLMGDGNLATEAALMKSDIDLNAQILKVGHHAAADSASESFLGRVSPQISIVSVNRKNIRGYPSTDTISRLQSRSKLYRTDISGSVEVKIYENGTFEVVSEK
jgi:competence protein ComEC